MPKTLSPWSVCLSMNPEMCQEGLDWDTKGGFVEWGPFLVHFPWVPFLAYTKVLKMTSIHSCTDILTFLCPFIRILQSFPLLLSTLHTYVFFQNRVMASPCQDKPEENDVRTLWRKKKGSSLALFINFFFPNVKMYDNCHVR